MLFSKSMKLVAFAVTAFASVSFAKPLAQAHGGVALSARGVHAGGVPQVAKRGLLDPLNLGNTVTGNTVPALLVNLNTNLGSLLTGDLSKFSCFFRLRSIGTLLRVPETELFPAAMVVPSVSPPTSRPSRPSLRLLRTF
jgi:hypothetical protein